MCNVLKKKTGKEKKNKTIVTVYIAESLLTFYDSLSPPKKWRRELNWCSSIPHLITFLQRAIKPCLTALQIGVFTFLAQENIEWLKNKLRNSKMALSLCHNKANAEGSIDKRWCHIQLKVNEHLVSLLLLEQ